MKWLLILSSALVSLSLLAGCGSRSIKPDPDEVVASRDPAPKECKERGKVTGTTISTTGTTDQALEDMKKEAANKGANYILVQEYSAYGTSVTGLAYECP